MSSNQMKQTEIGLIPEDWEVKSIGTLAVKILGGGTPPRAIKSYWGGIIPWVTVKDFKSFTPLSTQEYITDQGLKNSSTRLVSKGEIIIATRIALGEIAIYDIDVSINQDLKCIYLDKAVSKRYFYYSYKNIATKIVEKGSGSTVMGLSINDLKAFQISIPQISEQEAIATALDNVDKWIESIEKLIAKKRLIKNGAITKLFTHKDGWYTKRLSEIAKVTRGASPRPIESPVWFDYKSNIGWVRISDVTKSAKYLKETVQKLSDLGVKNSRFVKSNSLIMSICATIGKPIITKMDVCIHDGFVVFTDLKVDQDFLYNYLKFIELDWSKNGQTGSQMNLNTSIINSTEISFPNSINEQIHIATILSNIDSEISALESKQQIARQLKQGVMQQLLTGKVRLKDSTDNLKVLSPKHNEHFEDAVLIASLAHCFASPNFPLTRFKYTKVSYLLKRYKKHQAEGYLKKVAGPYKPQTRYGGAEKIALSKRYIASQKTVYKGKEYDGFVPGDNTAEALHYFKEWYGDDAITWIEQFKFEKNDHLELWTTIDMAVEELKHEKKIVNVAAVKQILKADKEWKDKLTRPVFSDDRIQQAIIKLDTLFD
ncbi:restriction endonuclease subunit S [Mucilaginibacter sp.]